MGKLRAFFSRQDQQKLEEGLANTKKSFLSKLGTALIGKTKIDEELLDELENILIQSDVGVATTIKIIDALEDRTAKEKYLGNDDLMRMMQEEIMELLVSHDSEVDKTQEKVTGSVTLSLLKGNINIKSRTSDSSLYDPKIVTFEDDENTYDQADASGFIKINSLRLRLNAKRNK